MSPAGGLTVTKSEKMIHRTVPFADVQVSAGGDGLMDEVDRMAHGAA